MSNRLTKLEGAVVVSYSYDDANHLTAKWSPTVRVTYSYDANGNTTVEDNADQLTIYSWDLENRVTGVQLPAGGLNTMVGACPERQRRDGDGKRHGYADSVILRNFIWDGESIARQTDVNGATARRGMQASRHAKSRSGGIGC